MIFRRAISIFDGGEIQKQKANGWTYQDEMEEELVFLKGYWSKKRRHGTAAKGGKGTCGEFREL